MQTALTDYIAKMKYALFLLVFWSLFPLIGCESGRNPVDGVVVYDFDFDLDPDVVWCGL